VKINGYEVSDHLIELTHRWPLRYDPEHPDAIGLHRHITETFVANGNPTYQGVLICEAREFGESDATCSQRIIPDDGTGLLHHLMRSHGYRMDGHQYNNANQIVGEAADAYR
jgi:hypothetical protein